MTKMVADTIVLPLMRKRVPQDEIVLVALTRGEQATLRSRSRNTMDAATYRYDYLLEHGLLSAQETPR